MFRPFYKKLYEKVDKHFAAVFSRLLLFPAVFFSVFLLLAIFRCFLNVSSVSSCFLLFSAVFFTQFFYTWKALSRQIFR